MRLKWTVNSIFLCTISPLKKFMIQAYIIDCLWVLQSRIVHKEDNNCGNQMTWLNPPASGEMSINDWNPSELLVCGDLSKILCFYMATVLNFLERLWRFFFHLKLFTFREPKTNFFLFFSLLLFLSFFDVAKGCSQVIYCYHFKTANSPVQIWFYEINLPSIQTYAAAQPEPHSIYMSE